MQNHKNLISVHDLKTSFAQALCCFVFRVGSQGAEVVRTPGKPLKRPETIPEEQEQGMEPSKEKITSTGTQISKPSQISAVPQRPPTAPRSPSQRRPSSSPQRPYSPRGGKPVSFVGQRPDSEPQSRESRPFSPAGSSDSSISPILLEIPAFQLSDKVEQLTKDEVRRC